MSGAQQEDPLGPLLFPLALKPVTDRLQALLPPNPSPPEVSFFVFSTDDGVINAPHSVLSRVPEELAFPHILSYGLHPRMDECFVLRPSAPPPHIRAAYPPTLTQHFNQAGTVLLQAPIGTDDFIHAYLDNFLVNLKYLIQAIEDIEDIQTVFTLLHMCAVVAKIAYLLHLISQRPSLPFSKRFDSLTLSSPRRLAGGILPDYCIDEFRLPLDFPEPSFGIGPTAAADLAAPFFLEFINLVEPLLSRVLRPHSLPCSEGLDVLAVFTAWTDFVPLPNRNPSQRSCANHSLSASSRHRSIDAALTPSTLTTPAPGLFDRSWGFAAPGTSYVVRLTHTYTRILKTCISAHGLDSIAGFLLLHPTPHVLNSPVPSF